MGTETNIIQETLTTREKIRKQIIKLERTNDAQKPDGLRDSDMVDRIKKIIETEVGK